MPDSFATRGATSFGNQIRIVFTLFDLRLDDLQLNARNLSLVVQRYRSQLDTQRRDGGNRGLPLLLDDDSQQDLKVKGHRLPHLDAMATHLPRLQSRIDEVDASAFGFGQQIPDLCRIQGLGLLWPRGMWPRGDGGRQRHRRGGDNGGGDSSVRPRRRLVAARATADAHGNEDGGALHHPLTQSAHTAHIRPSQRIPAVLKRHYPRARTCLDQTR